MTARFGPKTADHVRAFFGTPPTPLVPLRSPAKDWGLAGVYIKDEAHRLGQQAFKVVGGTFAMAKWMAKELGKPVEECGGIQGLKKLYSEHTGGVPKTFVTCTDGNHGRGLAWAGKELGQKVVVYMPKGSAQARVDHCLNHGAECSVTDMNYDATVEFAGRKAREEGWVYLQDTTAPDYFEIPGWIMEGYTLMADEAVGQVLSLDSALPTHIFMQHGVGSMAAAVLSYMIERYRNEGSNPPVTVILEPSNAACAFESAKKGDGSSVLVEGDLDSMIAGLCCGQVSEIAWPLLWKHVDGAFIKVSDGLAGNGMRLLKQEGVESGECGGAAVGLLQRLMASKCAKAAELRKELDLSVESRVLIINTEGATDPANYEKQLKLQDVPYSIDDFEFVVRRIRKDLKRSFDEMSDPQAQ